LLTISVDLLGNKKKMKISMPYDAVHVNHIHFDDGSKRWLWGGGCPDAMTLLSGKPKSNKVGNRDAATNGAEGSS
jgi:hypothetical protein